MSGVLCVMTPGEVLMLLWCVDSWDIPFNVSKKIFSLIANNVIKCIVLYQQMQLASTLLILVLVLAQSTLTMLPVEVTKIPS